MSKLPDEYLTEEELLKLPMFAHLSRLTIARWRSEGRGPKCTVVGRKPFYRLGEINRWLLEAEGSLEHSPQSDAPHQAPGQAIRGRRRVGGHKTKSERREREA